MVAYKLRRAEIITEATWRQLTSRFREEWIASRNRHEEAETEDSGGPNYYVVKRHRSGRPQASSFRFIRTCCATPPATT
jgi:hypothetical protein